MTRRSLRLAAVAAAMAAALSACGSTHASSAPSTSTTTHAKRGHAKRGHAKAAHLSPSTYHVAATWAPVGPTPHFPGADPKLHKLFVSNLAAGTLTVIDTKQAVPKLLLRA